MQRRLHNQTLKKLLQKVTIGEYREFILAHATKDKNFKSAFELWFAHKDEGIDVSKKYTDLVKGIIRKYSTNGFIDYRATRNLTIDINELLEKGEFFSPEK